MLFTFLFKKKTSSCIVCEVRFCFQRYTYFVAWMWNASPKFLNLQTPSPVGRFGALRSVALPWGLVLENWCPVLSCFFFIWVQMQCGQLACFGSCCYAFLASCLTSPPKHRALHGTCQTAHIASPLSRFGWSILSEQWGRN